MVYSVLSGQAWRKAAAVGAALLAGLALLTAVWPVNAHGYGKQQLEQVEAGPYLVSAWTEPETVRVGDELHVTVSVQDKQEEFVLDGSVQVAAVTETEAGRQVSSAASHEDAVQKLFYEAALHLDRTGRWTVIISIDAEPGTGEARFDLDVQEAQDDALPWSWIGVGAVGVFVAIALGTQGIAKSRRGQRGRRSQ
jgi:hypothetical protein